MDYFVDGFAIDLRMVPGAPVALSRQGVRMNAEKEHVDKRADVEGDCREVVESDRVRSDSSRTLLQQLHQVQEELEQYYLNCLDLDSDLHVLRLDEIRIAHD